MFYKKQALWGRKAGKSAGFLRPKPINMMLLLAIFFNGCKLNSDIMNVAFDTNTWFLSLFKVRMTSSVVIVSNVLPSNYAVRLCKRSKVMRKVMDL